MLSACIFKSPTIECTMLRVRQETKTAKLSNNKKYVTHPRFSFISSSRASPVTRCTKSAPFLRRGRSSSPSSPPSSSCSPGCSSITYFIRVQSPMHIPRRPSRRSCNPGCVQCWGYTSDHARRPVLAPAVAAPAPFLQPRELALRLPQIGVNLVETRLNSGKLL